VIFLIVVSHGNMVYPSGYLRITECWDEIVRLSKLAMDPHPPRRNLEKGLWQANTDGALANILLGA